MKNEKKKSLTALELDPNFERQNKITKKNTFEAKFFYFRYRKKKREQNGDFNRQPPSCRPSDTSVGHKSRRRRWCPRTGNNKKMCLKKKRKEKAAGATLVTIFFCHWFSNRLIGSDWGGCVSGSPPGAVTGFFFPADLRVWSAGSWIHFMFYGCKWKFRIAGGCRGLDRVWFSIVFFSRLFITIFRFVRDVFYISTSSDRNGSNQSDCSRGSDGRFRSRTLVSGCRAHRFGSGFGFSSEFYCAPSSGIDRCWPLDRLGLAFYGVWPRASRRLF